MIVHLYSLDTPVIFQSGERKPRYAVRHNIEHIPRKLWKSEFELITFFPHCRCRIQGEHSGLTCEQFEASWGHVDVISCPACGVSLTKGDGEAGLASEQNSRVLLCIPQ